MNYNAKVRCCEFLKLNKNDIFEDDPYLSPKGKCLNSLARSWWLVGVGL
jgi:hypothetical protein